MATEGTPLKKSISIDTLSLQSSHKSNKNDEKFDNIEENKDTFSSTIGEVLSCISIAVGTGNLWRFPRILAQNATPDGAAAFLLAWTIFLVFWSIPIILTEYSAGRYTRRGVIQAVMYFLGVKSVWASCWIVVVSFMIASYYAVVVGWCLYYLFETTINPLPTTYNESVVVFYDYTSSSWPVFTQFVVIALTLLILIFGVSGIEKANVIMMPIMLIIVIFIFIWSLTLPYAIEGLDFVFSADWDTLADPNLWFDAISQNAFDTSAGAGTFIAFAAYLGKGPGIVKHSVGVPIVNNCVSLMAGIMIFCTAFSTILTMNPNTPNAVILSILQTTGPGSTGMTFVWIPVLLATLGTFGRVVGVLFFICLFVGGLTSYVAMIEMVVSIMEDFGAPRKISATIATSVSFLIGLGSALDLYFLTNQDFVWAYGLIINGLILEVMVIIFGSSKYRELTINNNWSDNDWHCPIIWEWFTKFIAPIEITVLLGWWLISSIVYDDCDDKCWYEIGVDTLITVLLEWSIVLVIVVVTNVAIVATSPTWFTKHVLYLEGLRAWRDALYVHEKAVEENEADPLTEIMDSI